MEASGGDGGDAWSGEVEDKGREGECRARKGRRWRIPGTKGGREKGDRTEAKTLTFFRKEKTLFLSERRNWLN